MKITCIDSKRIILGREYTPAKESLYVLIKLVEKIKFFVESKMKCRAKKFFNLRTVPSYKCEESDS